MILCSQSDCARVAHSRGLCRSHYMRLWRYGDAAKVIHEHHGMNKAPERNVWQKMKQRCLNPKSPDYKNYGGRDIMVCQRWMLFKNFYEDMGIRPSATHSIDRINNEGNYESGNCRWATKDEQVNNYRRNRFVTIGGKTQSLKRWVDELDLNYGRVHRRLQRGWAVSKALELSKGDT